MDTVSKNGKLYEVYNTNNKLILYLFRRFYRKVEVLCRGIGAAEKMGLDVGCGEGHLTNMLYQEGAVRNQLAIDLDPDRIAFAKENYPLNGVVYDVQDIYSLNKKREFDYVLALEILEHLPDPDKAIYTLRMCTVKEGCFIFSVPFEPYFHWGNILRGKHLKRFGKTPTHLNFWSKSEFISLISKYGRIESIYSYATFPWILVQGRFN